MFANIASLNNWRQKRGFSMDAFVRPMSVLMFSQVLSSSDPTAAKLVTLIIWPQLS